MKKYIAIGVVVCLCVFVLFFFLNRKTQSKKDDLLLYIEQTGPKREVLKTMYLAELMKLSVDKPIPFSKFDVKKAKNDLLKSPLIKEVVVKKTKPNLVYIDYITPEPIAWLCDFENVAIDEGGYIFPVSPFLSPKNLAQIYLGLSGFGQDEDDELFVNWNECLKGKRYNLAMDVYNIITNPDIKNTFKLKKIDVSRSFSPSYGKREVILTIEEELIINSNNKSVLCIFPKILRLNCQDYAQQLGNYLVLRKKILEDYKKQIQIDDFSQKEVVFSKRVIDFRIPKLAFIDEF